MFHFVSAQGSANSLDWQVKYLVLCSVILECPFVTRLPDMFGLVTLFSSDSAILSDEPDFATLSCLEPSCIIIAL